MEIVIGRHVELSFGNGSSLRGIVLGVSRDDELRLVELVVQTGTGTEQIDVDEDTSIRIVSMYMN